MDLRVLTAVFVTLLAIALGMSHGNLQSQDVLNTISGLQDTDLSSLVEQQTAGTKSANRTVTATFTAADPVQLELSGETTFALNLTPGTTAHIGDSSLTTRREETVRFTGFTGSVRLSGENITVDGTAREVVMGAFTFNYSSPRVVKITDGQLSSAAFSGLQKQSIVFGDATGTANLHNTTITLNEEEAVFNAFSGDLTVPQPKTYRVEGTYHRAVLGPVTSPSTS